MFNHYYPGLWSHFCQRETVIGNHQYDWPEWHRGREHFCFWGVEVADQVVRDYWLQCREQLSNYLQTDCRKQPHITLYVAGFFMSQISADDECCAQTLMHQKQCLQQALSGPFNLMVESPNSFAGAAFLEVVDGDKRLVSARQSLLQHYGDDRSVNYVPHLTLGLYDQAFPAAEVAAQLGQLKPQSFTLRVDELVLFSYSADDTRSPLVVEDRLALIPARDDSMA